MKLLIVKLSAFGDIIHSLPALNDLLANPSVTEVHWLVDARYAFVTRVFPPEVRVHHVQLRGGSPLSEARRATRDLKAEGFDAVLDLQGLIKSAMLARLAGTPVYGMDAAHLREPACRFMIRPVAFHPDEKHVVQQYRRVAAAPFEPRARGARPDSPIPYKAPQAEVDESMRFAAEIMLERWGLLDKRFAWLHTGGGWATKQLPEQTWKETGERLLADGIVPVFGWGNEAEGAMAGHLGKQIPGSIVPNSRLDMDTLCGVLAAASAVVGPDTGVVHLSAALGTPTVSFWGPSASWRSGPLGENHRQVESNPDCGPCFKRECDQFVCMDMIRPDAIMAAIHEIAR